MREVQVACPEAAPRALLEFSMQGIMGITWIRQAVLLHAEHGVALGAQVGAPRLYASGMEFR